MEPLRVHLFGGFLLERGSHVLPPIPSRAGRSLLAYLAHHRDRQHPRELLAGLLWPDLSESRARRRLSHVLWQIQDILGEAPGGSAHLIATSTMLGFNPDAPYWLDTEEFDRLLDQATGHDGDPRQLEALRGAVELYRGDFMAGAYDEWVTVPQAHYRERYLAALGRLVQVAKSHGNHSEALAYARRLTHEDPLREEAHQEVIRLCFLLGRTSEALSQYERVRAVLDDELGTEPSEATEQLRRKILRHRRAGTRPAGQASRAVLFETREEVPFIGREVERRVVIDALERTLSGRGGVVLVEGEPGVGKTRLAAETTEDASWRGFEILWGTAREDDQRPFGPLASALQTGLTPLRAEQLAQRLDPAWLSDTARLVPELERWLPDLPAPGVLRPTDEPERMPEALARTLAALGRITPTLVVVDDLQWADGETLDVLRRLATDLSDTRLAIALVYRSEETRGDAAVWDVVRILDRDAGLGRVILSPLSVFEVGEMIKRGLGIAEVEGALAARLHRHSGGNALFALETLHALRDQGLIDEATGALAPAAAARLDLQRIEVTGRMEQVIGARIGLLDTEARHALETLAVVGDRRPLELVVRVAEGDRARTVEAIDELLSRRLVEMEEDRLWVRHDQIRQAVYDGISPSRRRELHTRVVQHMEALEIEDVDALAYHARRSGEPESAATHLVAAAARAEALHAFDTAARRYREAADLAEDARWRPERRFGLLASLESLVDILGRREEQAEVLDRMEALTTADAARAEVLRRRAMRAAHVDRFEEAEREASRAVEIARRHQLGALLAQSLVALGSALRWSGRNDAAVPHLTEAVSIEVPDPQITADALTALGSALIDLQRYSEAEGHLERAAAAYQELDDPRGEVEALGLLATGAMERGDTARAEAAHREALELATRIGYRHGEGRTSVNLANLCYLQGRIGEALEHYEHAARVFTDVGNHRGLAIVQANRASVLHAVLGADDVARQAAEDALSYYRSTGDQVGTAHCLEVLAGIEARRGDLEGAINLVSESLELAEEERNRWVLTQDLCSLAALLLEAGEADRALACAERAEELCAEVGLGDLVAEATSLEAMALLQLGHPGRALERSLAAVEALSPGVEHPHLVWLRRALIAEAAEEPDEHRRAVEQAHRLLWDTLSSLDPGTAAASWQRVPEHRRIREMWRAQQPTQIEVALPRIDAPTGRPLRPEEETVVRWTVATPADGEIGDPIEQRRHRLLRLLAEAKEQGASPTVEHLASAVEVSESTVRRDLSALRRSGFDVETRGRRTA